MDAQPERFKKNGHHAPRLNGTNGNHAHAEVAELIAKSGHAQASATLAEFSEPEPRMEWVESLGLFILRDENVIARVNRRFCSRVVDLLARSRRVRLAHVHLEDHALIVQFADPRTDRAEAARILGEAVRLASMPVPADQLNSGVLSPRWSGFTTFSAETGPVTSWLSVEVGKNRLRLQSDSLARSEVTPAELTGLIPSLKSARRRWLKRGVTVKFDPAQSRPLDLIRSLDTICRLEAASILPETDENPLASISLPRRMWHLGLAGASLVGAGVGLVVPGVPTVPFVLLTSYHLARGSDRMHRVFLRLPLFGSLAHDWSDGRFIRPSNKLILIALTTGIVGVTLLVSPVTPGVLMVVGLVFTMTTISVLQTPSQSQAGLVPKVGISRGLRALPAMG